MLYEYIVHRNNVCLSKIYRLRLPASLIRADVELAENCLIEFSMHNVPGQNEINENRNDAELPQKQEQESLNNADIELCIAKIPDTTCQELTQSPEQPPHTMLTEKEKIFTIIMASFAAFISPVSASIYYPALNLLAQDLDVTVNKTNVTISVYMVRATRVHESIATDCNSRFSRHWRRLS